MEKFQENINNKIRIKKFFL